MHSAASVAYPVARSRRAGLWFAALWVSGSLPVVCWAVMVPAPLLLRVAMLGWAGICGVWVGWKWLQTGRSTLVWDGEAWSIEKSGGGADVRVASEARLSVSLDLQSMMLLRLQPAAGRLCWVVVDRAAAPARWHGLRCAVTGVLAG